jgi:hypothetical protein
MTAEKPPQRASSARSGSTTAPSTTSWAIRYDASRSQNRCHSVVRRRPKTNQNSMRRHNSEVLRLRFSTLTWPMRVPTIEHRLLSTEGARSSSANTHNVQAMADAPA